ncbi:MAG: SPFH domain-containing protein [Planctomycetes bacterium]|nr:SPFH domain-containing protein [Planctomycetota bacterium]MCB9870008.1 SPFH domain-containing protein [Planctomycetota bacterium]
MTSSASKSHEIRLSTLVPGIPVLLLGILIFPCSTIYWAVQAGRTKDPTWALAIFGSILTGVLIYRSLVLVNPNQSRVLVLFGRYVGSVCRDGFFAVNPFTARRMISLRLHNFNSDTLKVNDNRGNPIEIGAVVVWRVQNTAQAAFDVEDYESFVAIQTESALRHLAASHPYDTHGERDDDDTVSLRGSSEVVNAELEKELALRLEVAGIEVMEARLQHLAYAPEIASAMLQRQQADAIISARTRIVDGAVGMVKMALEKLKDEGVVSLDEERKAAMTSNLLVVLCSERGTQPVVNSGTLH